MIEIWTYLGPILLADLLNPVLFAFLVYAAGTNLAVINSGAVLIGHTLAYFAAVSLFLLALIPLVNLCLSLPALALLLVWLLALF